MIIIQTIFVYISLAFLMSWFAKISLKRNNEWLLLIPVVLYALVFGFRYKVGIDYVTYTDIYENIEYSYKFERFEPGFKYISILCHQLGLTSPWYHLVLCFFQMCFLYLAFKGYKDVLIWLPYPLLLTGTVQLTFMNGIRQTIAFCMFVLALKTLFTKRWLLYYAIIFVAFLFHKSALILLPIGLISLFPNRKFFSVTSQIFLYGISIILIYVKPLDQLFSIMDYFAQLLDYEGYLTSKYNQYTSEIGFMNIVQIMLWTSLIYKSPKILQYYNNPFVDLIYSFAFCGLLLQNVLSGNLALLRIVMYFSLYEYLFLAFALNYFYKQEKKLFQTLIFYLIITSSRLLFYSESNSSQYVTVFQKEYMDIKDQQWNKMILDRNQRWK